MKTTHQKSAVAGEYPKPTWHPNFSENFTQLPGGQEQLKSSLNSTTSRWRDCVTPQRFAATNVVILCCISCPSSPFSSLFPYFLSFPGALSTRVSQPSLHQQLFPTSQRVLCLAQSAHLGDWKLWPTFRSNNIWKKYIYIRHYKTKINIKTNNPQHVTEWWWWWWGRRRRQWQWQWQWTQPLWGDGGHDSENDSMWEHHVLWVNMGQHGATMFVKQKVLVPHWKCTWQSLVSLFSHGYGWKPLKPLNTFV